MGLFDEFDDSKQVKKGLFDEFDDPKQPIAQQLEPESPSTLRRGADLGVGLIKGAVNTPTALAKPFVLAADLASYGGRKLSSLVTGTEMPADQSFLPSNQVSSVVDSMGHAADVAGVPQGLRPTNWSKGLDTLYSPAQQQATKAAEDVGVRAEAEAKATGSGALGQIGAGLLGTVKGAAANPSAIVPMITENVAQLFSGATITKKLIEPTIKAVTTRVAAGTLSKEAADKIITKAATKFSAGVEGITTTGQTLDQIDEKSPDADLLHRMASIPAGVLSTAISRGMSKVPGFENVEGKLATKGAVDITESRFRAGVKGLVSEGLMQEPFQEGQEQIWQNLGTDSPWQEGVGQSMVQGVLAGGPTGGVMGAMTGGSSGKTLSDKANQAITDGMLKKVVDSNLSAPELVALRETPAALARMGLTPDHINELLSKHHPDSVESASFEALLTNAPSAELREGLLASHRGQAYTKMMADKAAEKAVGPAEISHDEAIVRAAARRTELAQRVDLTDAEATELKTLNKAGLDGSKLASALGVTIKGLKTQGADPKAIENLMMSGLTREEAEAHAAEHFAAKQAKTEPIIDTKALATVTEAVKKTKTFSERESLLAEWQDLNSVPIADRDTSHSALLQQVQDEVTAKNEELKLTPEYLAWKAQFDSAKATVPTKKTETAAPIETAPTAETIVPAAVSTPAPAETAVTKEEAPPAKAEAVVHPSADDTNTHANLVALGLSPEAATKIIARKNAEAKAAPVETAPVTSEADLNKALEQEIANADKTAQQEVITGETLKTRSTEAFAAESVKTEATAAPTETTIIQTPVGTPPVPPVPPKGPKQVSSAEALKMGEYQRNLLKAKAKTSKLSPIETTQLIQLEKHQNNIQGLAKALGVVVKLDPKPAPAVKSNALLDQAKRRLNYLTAKEKTKRASETDIAEIAALKEAGEDLGKLAKHFKKEVKVVKEYKKEPPIKEAPKETPLAKEPKKVPPKKRKSLDEQAEEAMAKVAHQEKIAEAKKKITQYTNAHVAANKTKDVILASTYKALLTKAKAHLDTLKSVQVGSDQDSNEMSSRAQAISKSVQKPKIQTKKRARQIISDIDGNLQASGGQVESKADDDIKASKASRLPEFKKWLKKQVAMGQDSDENITVAMTFFDAIGSWLDKIHGSGLDKTLQTIAPHKVYGIEGTDGLAEAYVSDIGSAIVLLDTNALTERDIAGAGLENANMTEVDRAINQARADAISAIEEYFKSNYMLYPVQTQAIALSLLTKYNFWYDASTGKAMSSKITPRTLTTGSIFSGALAAAFNLNIHDGQSPKEAYKNAIEKVYASKDSSSIYKAAGVAETGWHIFGQSNNSKDVENLASIAATSPSNWCTGHGAAASHLGGGDFHIYSEDGVALIAIRMDDDEIGEISGSLEGQNLAESEIDRVLKYVEDQQIDSSGQTVNNIVTDQKNTRAMREWLNNDGATPITFDVTVNINDTTRGIRRRNSLSTSRLHDRYADVHMLGADGKAFDDLLKKSADQVIKQTPGADGMSTDVVIDLVKVSRVTASGATHNVSMPNLVSADDITLRESVSFSAPNLTTASSINIEGSQVAFPKLTSVDSINITGKKASLSAPVLVTLGNTNNYNAALNVMHYSYLDVPMLEVSNTLLVLDIGTSINAPKLHTVKGIHSSVTITLPGITSVGNYIEATKGGKLTLPSLTSFGFTEASSFYTIKVGNGSEVNLPAVTSILRTDVIITRKGAINLESLTTFNGDISTNMLGAISAPLLETIQGNVQFHGPTPMAESARNFQQLIMPKLDAIMGEVRTAHEADIELHGVQHVRTLLIESITRLSMPDLKSVGGDVTIRHNAKLTADNLTTIEGIAIVPDNGLQMDPKTHKMIADENGKYIRAASGSNALIAPKLSPDTKMRQDIVISRKERQEQLSSEQSDQVDLTESDTRVSDLQDSLTTEHGEAWTNLETKGENNESGGAVIRPTLVSALEYLGSTADIEAYSSDGTNIQALHNRKTGLTVLIAEHLNPEDATGVLVHEIGVHSVNDPSLDKAALDLFKSHRDSEFMRAVRERMRLAGHLDSKGDPTDVNELRAYIVEEAINKGGHTELDSKFWKWANWNLPKGVVAFLRRVANMISAGLDKAGIKDRVLTVHDLVSIAKVTTFTNPTMEQSYESETTEDAQVVLKQNKGNNTTTLAKAVSMLEKGASKQEVMDATGWFENADGVLVQGNESVTVEGAEPLAASRRRANLTPNEKAAIKALEQIFDAKGAKLDEVISKTAEQLAMQTANPVTRTMYNLTTKLYDSYIRDKNNQDSSWAERIASSPEFYFQKTQATAAILQAALDDGDAKYVSQKQILGKFQDLADNLLKTNERLYKAAGKYLLDTDRTGVSFKVSLKDGVYTVKDRADKEVSMHADENEAYDALVQAEQDWLATRLVDPRVREMIKEARQLTNRAFNILAKDMRDQMSRAKAEGRPEPKAVYINEDGKQEEVALSELIADMGDLRGSYFPRERVARNFHLVAEKDGQPSKMETFDWHIIENELGWNKVEKMKRTFNNAAPAGRRARELQKDGWTVSIRPVSTPTEMLFDLPGTLATLDSLLNEASKKLSAEAIKAADIKLLEAADRALALRIADIYKAKGNLSSRMARADKYYEGFETDPIRALVGYASRLSTGVAKRTTARKMLEAFTGRTIPWSAYQKLHPTATYENYLKHVKEQKIDPTRQKKMYEDARMYMKYFLSPDSGMGRAIGFLKAGAVFKYLAFRMGSAALNFTTMGMSVPATIAAHNGSSLLSTAKSLTRATGVFAAYKHNQLVQKYKFLGRPMNISLDDIRIMNYIYDNGWAEAQFNHEAMQAMSGEVGRAANNVMAWGMYMFGAIEQANRAITIFAAYDNLSKNGLTRKGVTDRALSTGTKLQLAKHTSDRAHGIYGKAAKPWLVQHFRLLDATYTFQKYQHTYHLNMLELTSKYKSPGASAFMALMPQLLAGTSTVALLVMGALKKAGADDPQESYEEMLAKMLGDSSFAKDFATYGLIGAVTGVNLKGSLETKSPFPTTMAELFGAPEALFIDTAKGMKALSKGEVSKGLEGLFPTAVGSPMKGYREMKEGVTKSNYAPVFEKGEMVKGTAVDFAKRFLSFNPTRISGIRNDEWREDEVRRAYTTARTEMSSLYNRLVVQQVPAEDPQWADLMKSMMVYNRKASLANPKYIIPFVDADWLAQESTRAFSPTKYTKQ